MCEKKQWVQHISGQGEKWEAIDDDEFEWIVRAKHQVTWGRHFLPKSEYRLCDPPEMWKDVTEFVHVVSRGEYSNLVYNGENVRVDNGGYRLRKVQLETPHKCGKTLASIVWAFIVEQKVTQ